MAISPPCEGAPNFVGDVAKAKLVTALLFSSKCDLCRRPFVVKNSEQVYIL